MKTVIDHVQIIGDFIRFGTPQIAAKLAVQLGRRATHEFNNRPRSVRLLAFVEFHFYHRVNSPPICPYPPCLSVCTLFVSRPT